MSLTLVSDSLAALDYVRERIKRGVGIGHKRLAVSGQSNYPFGCWGQL